MDDMKSVRIRGLHASELRAGSLDWKCFEVSFLFSPPNSSVSVRAHLSTARIENTVWKK